MSGQARGKRTVAIRSPRRSWFPLLRYRCRECHAGYWTVKGYEGHYARDHVLEVA